MGMKSLYLLFMAGDFKFYYFQLKKSSGNNDSFDFFPRFFPNGNEVRCTYWKSNISMGMQLEVFFPAGTFFGSFFQWVGVLSCQ